VDYLRLISAYTGPVFNLLESRLCDYTVRCKGCSENISAPVQTMPDTWNIAECPLCRSEAPVPAIRDIPRDAVAPAACQDHDTGVSPWVRCEE
jgi:hypothetical protein